MDEQAVPMDDSTRRMDRPARLLYLASIGAIATAYDTAEDAFDRFVRRGEAAQEEFEERRQHLGRENVVAPTRLRESVRSAMEVVRDQLDVPSKTEVDAINVKLNIVLRKLDDLSMDLTGEPSMATETVEPPLPPSAVDPDVPTDTDLPT